MIPLARNSLSLCVPHSGRGVPHHLLGILQMARNSMMSAIASDGYASRYWQAGGSPTTVISTDQELNTVQAEELGSRWRDRRAKGPDYPAVLGEGSRCQAMGSRHCQCRGD